MASKNAPNTFTDFPRNLISPKIKLLTPTTATAAPSRATTDVFASDESTAPHSGVPPPTKTSIQRSASSDAIVLMNHLHGGSSHSFGKSLKPMQASSSNLRRHLTPNLSFSAATNYHKMLESNTGEQKYLPFNKWLQGSTEYLNQELEKLALANEMAEREKLSSIPDGHRAPIDELLLMFCDSPNNNNSNNDFIDCSDGVVRHKKIFINDINVISDSNNNNLSTDDENNNNNNNNTGSGNSAVGRKEVMIKSITNIIGMCRDINDNNTNNNNNIGFAVGNVESDIAVISQRQQHISNNTLDNAKPPLIVAKIPSQQQQQSQHQQQQSQHQQQQSQHQQQQFQHQQQQQNVPSIPSNQSAFVTLPRSFKVKQLGEVTMATT